MNKTEVKRLYEDQVFKIILNAPKGNILDSEMLTEIGDVLDDLADKRDVKVVVFQGAGDHFSFGASVEEHRKEHVAGMLTLFHSIIYKLVDLSLPTAAMVSGQCLGGGMELAATCQFIFADETARFGLPEINLGLFPPAGSVMLPLKIGTANADSLLITGRSIPPREAKEMGFVNDLFETRESMEEGVKSWLEREILPKSASSLRLAVAAAHREFNMAVKKQLPAMEKTYLEKLMETDDANEGIEAFLQKRSPEWSNR